MQQAQYVPGTTRLKDTELVVPVATGTVASHLGKKASEFQSHRWTCYVRSPTQVGGGGGNGGGGGDLSLVLRAVTFALHPSFPDHVRTVEAPGPFELTETGWGEFDIGVTVRFRCLVVLFFFCEGGRVAIRRRESGAGNNVAGARDPALPRLSCADSGARCRATLQQSCSSLASASSTAPSRVPARQVT